MSIEIERKALMLEAELGRVKAELTAAKEELVALRAAAAAKPKSYKASSKKSS